MCLVLLQQPYAKMAFLAASHIALPCFKEVATFRKLSVKTKHGNSMNQLSSYKPSARFCDGKVCCAKAKCINGVVSFPTQTASVASFAVCQHNAH